MAVFKVNKSSRNNEAEIVQITFKVAWKSLSPIRILNRMQNLEPEHFTQICFFLLLWPWPWLVTFIYNT